MEIHTVKLKSPDVIQKIGLCLVYCLISVENSRRIFYSIVARDLLGSYLSNWPSSEMTVRFSLAILGNSSIFKISATSSAPDPLAILAVENS
jgi:hypothetical protein